MMAAPSIAVIVPNRNDARYLPRCLGSLLEQEIGPDELLVVDDQSTDDSVAVIRSMIGGHPRTELLLNTVNLGVNRTINESLGRVRSDYVLLLSANDFVLPGIFARAKACFARWPGAGLWSAMSWLVDEEDRRIRLHASPVVALNDAHFSTERCVQLAHRFGNWFTGSTLIYHRDTLRAGGGFDPEYGAPSDLITALVIASQRGAAYSPESFAAIRVHRDSYSSQTLRDLASLEAMLGRLRSRGPERSPLLFTTRFLDRTTMRFRFAAIRTSNGALISAVAASHEDWKRTALFVIDRFVAPGLRTIRVAAAFLILRPFDILPTFWNRILGWIVVRLRMALRQNPLS